MPRARALVERSLYEQVMPRIAIAQPRLREYAGDEESSLAWMFLEDPGTASCEAVADVGALARWLGHLHASAEWLDGNSMPATVSDEPLADRYRRIIRMATQRLSAGLDNPALQRSDQSLIRSVISACSRAERRLPALARSCATASPTLLHGDPSSEYVRLAHGQVYALDWEFCAWAPPAPDLYVLYENDVALRIYCDARAEHGRPAAEHTLRELAALGYGLRLLAAVEWATPYLETLWPEKGIARLRACAQPLGAWVHDHRIAA
jgi:hypothetical protein